MFVVVFIAVAPGASKPLRTLPIKLVLGENNALVLEAVDVPDAWVTPVSWRNERWLLGFILVVPKFPVGVNRDSDPGWVVVLL